jgi:hypothetical protein
MVVSFTFLELGAAALSRGTVWTTLVSVRSTTIAKVQLAIQVFLVSLGLALEPIFLHTDQRLRRIRQPFSELRSAAI